MMDKETEQILRISHSFIYKVFGFGTDSIDFAKRVIKLMETEKARSKVFNNIADRLSFIDYLRFQVGWDIETLEDYGDRFRLSDNLDALETYLLCTCIDTLAGGGDQTSFPEWLSLYSKELQDELNTSNISESLQYIEMTERLFARYEETEQSLSRKFYNIFDSLPDYWKETLTNSIVLIPGGYLAKTVTEQLEEWNKLTLDQKIKKIALRYYYGIRRSKYTHASIIIEALLSSHWRRLVEKGILPAKYLGEGWKYTSLKSSKNPDKIEFTIISHGSVDENFLLRAIISYHILKNYLYYSIPDDYLEKLLRQYQALSAIYAFVNEIKRNRDKLNYITSVHAISPLSIHQYSSIERLSTTAGELLIEKFSVVVGILKNEIEQYLYWLGKLNGFINEFNKKYPPRKSEWPKREKELRAFSQRLARSQEVGQIIWYENSLSINLKRFVESGKVHYQYAGLIN